MKKYTLEELFGNRLPQLEDDLLSYLTESDITPEKLLKGINLRKRVERMCKKEGMTLEELDSVQEVLRNAPGCFGEALTAELVLQMAETNTDKD